MAKNDCQKAILAVLPIMPQVAKDITMITHQGAIICSKKQIINMTMKTILHYLEIFKREIIFPDLSSGVCM